MSKAPIAFEQVSKSYRDFMLRLRAPALKDFSMKVAEGEIVGLLGPNGSGKSTALNIIVGLLRPTQGKALLFGRNPREAKARRVLGYLPEENANIPSLSGRKLVEVHAELAGLKSKDAKSKAEELLERVGLSDALDRKAGTYSKGMSRRLGLAQCMVGSPTVLVLDEPTSGLDPVATELVRDLLVECKSNGVSVLLSSHLLAEIEDICDRLIVLRKGDTIRSGSANELLSLPDRSRIELSALSPEELESFQRWAMENKVTIHSQSTPNRSLSEFYRKVVDNAEGQAP